MPLLDCSAKHCTYNCDCLCSKHEISVDGDTADTSEATCCASFKERTGNTASNSMSTPARETGVICEATKCVYNENKYCAAEQIGITGANATSAGNTECATFKMR